MTHRTPTLLLVLSLAACASTSSRAPAPADLHRDWSPAAGPPIAAAPAAPAHQPTASAQAPAPAPRTSDAPRNYETVTLKLMGVTCPIKCAREVKEQLLAVPGVMHVQVDTDTKRAIVDLAPGTDPEELLRGLKAPYSGRIL